jgi:hypothetical protein
MQRFSLAIFHQGGNVSLEERGGASPYYRAKEEERYATPTPY